jgi:hypothetical protein
MDFSTKIEELTKRHSMYDKPSNKQLQDIGAIEYFWQAFFDKAIAKRCCEAQIAKQDWEKGAIDLKHIIQERCVNNFERRHTLNLLDQAVNRLQSYNTDYEKILILLEGIKDWARKSVVRGEDIK